MTGWLSLSREQRQQTLQYSAQTSGMPPHAIEKDWWVTLTLKALFQSAYANHLIFKGGTSLSKGWKLIQRFSEDIDLAIDPVVFNMKYKQTPTKGDVERLRRKGCEFTSIRLKQSLYEQFSSLGVPSEWYTITAETVTPQRPDKDPQRLFIEFDSVLQPTSYLKNSVQVEVSSRSLLEPFSTRPVTSLIHEYFPNPSYYPETPFLVPIVAPRKTFLEKAFLLNEEFSRPNGERIRIERMSRHFYDMIKMDQEGITDEALADKVLYTTIQKHRRYYSRLKHMGNYASLDRGNISFIPPAHLHDAYRQDYRYMTEHMMYGEVPQFSVMLDGLQTILNKFRRQA
ncbi:nucleotidyl transferase AbiEii/AbiGii toxin family protein [Chitinophaga qingshengii]|uniref:Nucleotidyl transferase AbiEii/AbiGii toxin family protein n=1 Tax=Chitinophaga qingshengii TaxID=1569794 RepID=A0ABR7TN17_9BACT|nr:nucleotidyl transferase AbiEii/AbiGii toxin family protein [Chitinophaga qingshengii]MBC9930943.1 nucleotidyl transferase AbiEii/AbiGii toxin family protein [Chitinophaga qingshengii]